tara:strand:- start:96 stop:995 length:900 start_codon:yes stop_codon:yes gene_type:complete
MPTIDFTTFNENTLRNFKPVMAKKIQPDWWKKMKVFQAVRGRRTQTIRACPAMHDWTKSGWYLLANRDIEVLCGSDRMSLSDENFTTKDTTRKSYESPTHPSDQFDNAFDYLKDGEFGHVKDAFKMRNPWNIITPPGYSTYYVDPFLFQNKFFAVWQGIIDTDKFNVNQDNSQIIFYPRVNESFTIKEGTPLCQVIPFKREEWIATYQLKDAKIWHENRSKYTTHEDVPTMDEQGRTKYNDQVKEKPNTLGPYRNEGYWQEKGQFYSETEPPPECPMHSMDKDFKKEQKKLTELNPDGD